MNARQTRLLGLVAGITVFAMSTGAWGAISGTKHDFSGEAWNTTGEICTVCHVPHSGGDNSIAPAWGHETTTANFTVYASGSLNATVGQPTGNSKACLSCHDGTVALDSFGGNSGTVPIQGTALVGTDLSNDHPVSFLYDAALAAADGSLATPTSASQVDPAGQLRLFAGRLECATCHDPHDDTHGNFLAVDNAGSALCLNCHAK